MALVGTEVKAIREGRVNLRDSFAKVEGGDVYVHNVHIGAYSSRGYADHEPLRPRKLLLHRHEIRKLIGKTTERGMTLVPVRMIFQERPRQDRDQPGEGEEGLRPPRDDQAPRARPGNARGGEERGR